MKKMIAWIMALVMLVTCIPVALAEEGYVTVTRDNAPIRNDKYETGDVLVRVPYGALLKVLDTTRNMYLHKWYKVSYNGVTGYIYEDNVKKHSHDFCKYTYHGVTYSVCRTCAYCEVTVTGSATISKSSASAVAGYATAGAFSAAADGPLPFGDVLGILIVGIGTLYELTTPSKAMVTELVSSLDDYLERERYTCSNESFYRVVRKDGTLVKESNECIPMAAAYARVLAGKDVWTLERNAAKECARLYGSYYSEVDKDQPGYWYHYHLGADAKHKNTKAGHIFYGTSVGYHEMPH